MQEDAGAPLPAGTQYGLVAAHAQELEPVLQELIRQAADGHLFFNDDTTARILDLAKQIREADAPPEGGVKPRTGIIAQRDQHSIALFFSGGQHAGENLQEVIETIRQVYQHDEQTWREAMSDKQRLLFHQQHSGPLMEGLKRWMEEKIEGRQVEPNRSLGEAMTYMLKHWDPLTVFLRQPGAPLDNNICYAARGIRQIMPRPGLCRVARNTAEFAGIIAVYGVDDAA